MEFFNINANLDNFLEISKNTKIKNTLGELYDTWELAVINFYDFASDIRTHKKIEDFKVLYSKLQTNLKVNPNKKSLEKMWHIYYATGKYIDLKLCFEVAGHPKTNSKLKELAIDLFQQYEQKYLVIQSKYGNLESFDKLSLEISNLMNENITEKVIENELPFNFAKEEESEEKNENETIEKIEKTKMQKAQDLFDEISKKVLSKTSLKKR